MASTRGSQVFEAISACCTSVYALYTCILVAHGWPLEMRTPNASLYVLSISTSHRHLEHVAHAGFAVSGRLHVFAQEELWIGRHLSTLPVCHM